ncbi:hypothetical protein PHYSODRAFT_328465 [Phytophthora sojae]|uniref:Alpha-type protein kinase domain-containing protein n=1 Tax=Phytophthora sojae (strain P6497) TaxID=1094619 RepID=G4Z6S7_PHYSP|nr:hypothetical protein PHYSODRAFT_328465 [Phytophthora sojae]EGZ20343.1 hypothetical protein PHYSODRAFT_328465 [Phytophthora sojae]|eukprot:XP_009523060.1 hypothetical protein PHYSODRAFT_328465 [Phytophthora sojae]
MEKCCLAKVYVDPAATSEACMNAKAQRHAVARKLASDFSAGFKDGSVGDGLIASWYEIEGLDASTTLFTVEPYVVKSTKSANEESEIGDKSQAFSHFTWQKTLGTLMAVDRDEVGSVFRDPLIHSIREGTFGPADFASAGMDALYSSHECNEICRAFGLAPLKGNDGKVKSKFVSTDSEPKSKQSPPPTVSRLPAPSPFVFRTCRLCGNSPRVVHTELTGCNEKGVFCEVCAAKADKPEPRHCNVCNAPMVVDAAQDHLATVCGDCEIVSRPAVPSGEQQTEASDTSGWTVVEDLSNQPA